MEKLPMAILSWGGFGDTLRNLSLIPHYPIYQTMGWQTPVIFQPWSELNCKEEALPPGPAAVRELVERCPSLRWAGVGHMGNFARYVNRAMRETGKLLRGNQVFYGGFPIRLTPEEEAALPILSSQRPQIAVQTHLLGLPCKKWPIERWRDFLQKIASAHPEKDFWLLEPDPAVDSLKVMANIFAHPTWTLPQSIAMARRMDAIISVDSWVKYVGAWERIPQFIIVPDIRLDYPVVSPSSLLKNEFAGLFHLPEVTLYGLNREKVSLDFAAMDDLTSETLLPAVLAFLDQNILSSQK